MDYLVLRNRESHHNTGKWSPYAMKRVEGEKVGIGNGIMYYHDEQVLPHLFGELWAFADCTPGETVDTGRWCLTRAGMITERYDGWNRDAARLFANDVARLAVDKYTVGEMRAKLHGCLDTALDHFDGYCRITDVDRAIADAHYVMYGTDRDSAEWETAHSVACAVESSDLMYGEYAAAIDALMFAQDAADVSGGVEEMRKAQYALLLRYAMGEHGPFVGQ